MAYSVGISSSFPLSWNSSPLHSANLLLVLILLQSSVQVLPPLKQHGVTDELEPRSEDKLGVVKHGLELVSGDVAGITDLIDIWRKIDIGLDEQNVVN